MQLGKNAPLFLCLLLSLTFMTLGATREKNPTLPDSISPPQGGLWGDAVKETLRNLDSGIPSDFQNLGERPFPTRNLSKTLIEFEKIRTLEKKAFQKALRSKFNLRKLSPKKALITAYFAPQFSAENQASSQATSPIYSSPPKRKNFSREEINHGALKDQNLEMAWLGRIDRFLLQLQGSGELLFPDGSRHFVTFDGHNGFPFVGIGSVLEKAGVKFRTSPWIEGFREYFSKHPDEMDRYFHQQKRFIFFRKSDGPRGLAGLSKDFQGSKLFPEISVASDTRHYPYGALLLFHFVNGNQEKVIFQISHDTGGPIRGPNRFDRYLGIGKEAGLQASQVKQNANVYILLPKNPNGVRPH